MLGDQQETCIPALERCTDLIILEGSWRKKLDRQLIRPGTDTAILANVRRVQCRRLQASMELLSSQSLYVLGAYVCLVRSVSVHMGWGHGWVCKLPGARQDCWAIQWGPAGFFHVDHHLFIHSTTVFPVAILCLAMCRSLERKLFSSSRPQYPCGKWNPWPS